MLISQSKCVFDTCEKRFANEIKAVRNSFAADILTWTFCHFEQELNVTLVHNYPMFEVQTRFESVMQTVDHIFQQERTKTLSRNKTKTASFAKSTKSRTKNSEFYNAAVDFNRCLNGYFSFTSRKVSQYVVRQD